MRREKTQSRAERKEEVEVRGGTKRATERGWEENIGYMINLLSSKQEDLTQQRCLERRHSSAGV